MPRVRGVIAATATPVREDLSIALDALVEQCRWLLTEGGCDAINLLGTTGEAVSFSVRQRLEAMTAIAKSDLPTNLFMVGTGAAALDDTCTLTAAAKSLGFAGALVVPPFYYKGIDQGGLVDFIDALVKTVGKEELSLYLYHFPSNTGVPYSVEVVTELRQMHGGVIAGLKDSSNDIEYSSTLAAQLPGFDVFPSAEGSLAEAHVHGFAGCISATTNVTGKLAQKVWSDPSGPGSLEALKRANEIRRCLTSYPLVSAVKAAIAERTGNETWLRVMPPLMPLTANARARLTSDLTSFVSTETLIP